MTNLGFIFSSITAYFQALPMVRRKREMSASAGSIFHSNRMEGGCKIEEEVICASIRELCLELNSQLAL